MSHIFEVLDKIGRKVRLSPFSWTHIRTEHPNVESLDEITIALKNPDKIILDERENVEYIFKYLKYKNQKSKFLKIIVKYINNEGNILSAHFVRQIK